MIELIMCYTSIKSQSMFFDRLLLSNLHIELKLVNLICVMNSHIAVKWLKNCQYGVKHYPIKQSMYIRTEGTIHHHEDITYKRIHQVAFDISRV